MERGQTQSGNFLTQALLALALIAAFIPVFVGRSVRQFSDAQMTAAISQIDQAIFAGTQYARGANITNGKRSFSGVRLTDTLSDYGLPPGFQTTTIYGQKISMFTARNADNKIVMLELAGGNLSQMSRAALMQRLGPAAGTADKNIITGIMGDWKIDLTPFGLRPDASSIYIRLDDDDLFVELVRVSGDRQKFLTDLDMGGNDLTGAHIIAAVTAKIENITATKINVSGNGKQSVSQIDAVSGNATGPVSFGRADLGVVSARLASISASGTAGNLEADSLFVPVFSMSHGSTGFTGGKKWHVSGNMSAKNFNLNIEALEIGGTLNMSNTPDILTGEVWEQGINTATLYAAFVSLRDVYASEYTGGSAGRVISEVRPAATSIFSDVKSATIGNDAVTILKNPLDSSSETETCKSIINRVSNAKYESASLTQNIICRYMFWHRLEQRINEKMKQHGM